MAVDGGTKLGLVSRWSEAVEGWSEVCCVDQSQDVRSGTFESGSVGKAPMFMEPAMAARVTIAWPNVAAFKSTENSDLFSCVL